MFLSDNGSKFKGAFDQALQRMKITHYWTYQKSARMSAQAEALQPNPPESCIDFNEDLLLTDIELFNQKLAQWFITYNTLIPHRSLGLRSEVKLAPP